MSSSDEQKQKKRKKQQKSKPSKKKRKGTGRQSATQRQEDIYRDLKELDERRGKDGYKLMKRWRCDSSSCSNKGHYCWQPEGAANVHIKLFDTHIAAWNKALAKGKEDVSVEKPPAKLRMELYEMQRIQSETSKPKKERIEAEAKETPTWAGQMVSPYSLPGFQTSGSIF